MQCRQRDARDEKNQSMTTPDDCNKINMTPFVFLTSLINRCQSYRNNAFVVKQLHFSSLRIFTLTCSKKRRSHVIIFLMIGFRKNLHTKNHIRHNVVKFAVVGACCSHIHTKCQANISKSGNNICKIAEPVSGRE